MAFYFTNVPDFEYVSRLPDKRNLSDHIQVKNIFKRAKIRDDIFKNLQYFTKYNIIGDERPDAIADKFYKDSTLDWVILLANNILNVYNEWPKPQASFDNYLLEKYGSYERLYKEIHHYETKEVKASNNIIIQNGLIVNEGFYKAPEYVIETDPNVILPTIVPGIYGEAISSLSNTKISNLTLTNAGLGYTYAKITVEDPPQKITATASAVLSSVPGEREISSTIILNAGRGYSSQPTITFSDPTPTIPSIATAIIGAGGSVTSVSIGNSGEGYTFTPTVSFSYPEDIIGNSIFLNQSPFTVASNFEGSYISPDGTYFYTSHSSGTIDQYTLSTPWDITTGNYITTFTLGNSVIYNGSYQNDILGVEFKPDGSRMYVCGSIGNSSTGQIVTYRLIVPWDLSTAVYSSTKSTPNSVKRIRFQDNGKYIFLLDSYNHIDTYRLISAWNVISLVPSVITTIDLKQIIIDNDQSLINQNIIFSGINFNDTGTELYAGDLETQRLYVFALSTSWNLDTIAVLSYLDMSTYDNYPMDGFIDSERTKLFVSGNENNKIYEYNIDLQAKGYATISNEKLSNIVITNFGGGYIDPPIITIEPPIPSRTAIGYILITNSKVSQIIITDPGYNYLQTPNIIIQDPIQAKTALVNAKVENGKIIDLIIVDGGSGYETAPQLYFSKPNNLYEPSINEIYSIYGQEWKYDGHNWYKRLTFGTQYYNENMGKIVEISGIDSCIPITNYEYEIRNEDKKRTIFILKDTYLSVVLNDIESIMQYKEGSTQFLSRTLKRGDNPRFYE